MPKRRQPPQRGPTKEKGELPIREAAELEQETTRRGSREDTGRERDLERGAPPPGGEYGEGVTQNE